MKKRLLACLLLLALLVLALPVNAAEETAYLRDNADLLTDDEAQTLQTLLSEISSRQQLDVIVVTLDSLDGESALECAHSQYDMYGYGYGSSRDGILLLISMAQRDWAISTNGYATAVFTDGGQAYLSDQFLPDLSNGNYFEAFSTYAHTCDTALTRARNNPSENPFPRALLSWKFLPISFVLGLVIALIAVGIMKRQLKSVRSQAAAHSYVRSGSMQLTQRSDLFLYRTVTRRAKPKSNSSSGGGGSSRGGSSGKF